MKLPLSILLAFTIVICTLCKKEDTKTVPSAKGYAKFTDIINGKPFRNLPVDLVSCSTTDIYGQCSGFNYLYRKYTDSTGTFEYDQNGARGFACQPDNFFPILKDGIAKFGYDGATSYIQLVPKAYLDIDISPSSAYPKGYKLFFQWDCFDNTNIRLGGDALYLSDQADAVAGIHRKIIAGDIGNEIRWQLVDTVNHTILSDTIKNLIAHRFDTTTIKLNF